MKFGEIRAALVAAYGPEWQGAVARKLGVSSRSVRRWVEAGAFPSRILAELGIDDGRAPRLFPRDEWILGDGAPLPGGGRIEYVVHARAPRFVARLALDDDDPPLDPAGLVWSGDGYAVGEFCWIDPPPATEEFRATMRALDGFLGQQED